MVGNVELTLYSIVHKTVLKKVYKKNLTLAKAFWPNNILSWFELFVLLVLIFTHFFRFVNPYFVIDILGM